MSTITIHPFEQTTIKIATSISLHIQELILHEKAVFRVSLHDEDGRCTSNHFVTIDGEDYKKWSSDDQYVVNFIAAQLGFVLAQ